MARPQREARKPTTIPWHCTSTCATNSTQTIEPHQSKNRILKKGMTMSSTIKRTAPYQVAHNAGYGLAPFVHLTQVRCCAHPGLSRHYHYESLSKHHGKDSTWISLTFKYLLRQGGRPCGTPCPHLAARVISRFPFSPRSGGTTMMISGT